MRSACRWIMAMVSRCSSGVSPYFSAYSQALLITDTGVRSSWEASAVNWASASKARSSLANMPLKVPASRENSLLPGGTSTRRDRSAASLMASAVAVSCSRGRKARRAMR